MRIVVLDLLLDPGCGPGNDPALTPAFGCRPNKKMLPLTCSMSRATAWTRVLGRVTKASA